MTEGAGKEICKCYHWSCPLIQMENRPFFKLDCSIEKDELKNDTSSKTVHSSLPFPAKTWRLGTFPKPRRWWSQSCSQCQNRGQVEVYGGWLVFSHWLSDGGDDGGLGMCCMLKPVGPSEQQYRWSISSITAMSLRSGAVAAFCPSPPH